MEPYSTVSRPLPSSELWMTFAITARLLSMLIIGGLIIYGIYRLIKPSSMEHPDQTHAASTLRSMYFYLASFVGLFMLIVAAINLINLGLKAIFPRTDFYPGLSVEESCAPEIMKVEMPGTTRAQCEKKVAENINARNFARSASRHSDLAFDIGFIFVGAPLFGYHFLKVQGLRRTKKST